MNWLLVKLNGYLLDLPSSSQNDQCYFEALNKALDSYTSYKKIILAGDFNAEEKDMDGDIPLSA